MEIMKANIYIYPYILHSAWHLSSTEMITGKFLFCFIVFSIYRNLGMYQLFKHLFEKWENNTNNWRAVLFINHHIMPSPWCHEGLIKVKVTWQRVMITQRLLLFLSSHYASFFRLLEKNQEIKWIFKLRLHCEQKSFHYAFSLRLSKIYRESLSLLELRWKAEQYLVTRRLLEDSKKASCRSMQTSSTGGKQGPVWN